MYRSAVLWCTVGLLPCFGALLHGQASPPPSAHEGTVVHIQMPPPLERRVSLDLHNVPLRLALRDIDRQARLGLAFTPVVVPVDRLVTIQGDSITVAVALERVLQGTGVIPVVTTSQTIMLVKGAERSEIAPSDTTHYAMVVVHVTDDTTSRPLKGAVVTAKGTKSQESTTETGYTLLRNVPSGLRVITVRYLGYTPAERQILVPDTGYTQVNFQLKMGMAHLQEIVTTATGPQRRYELSNDITILNADSIVANERITSVTELLEGRVPGLTVQHTSGAPGDPSRLRLRGTSSVTRSNDPIVFLDGIRIYAAQSDSTSANLATLRTLNGRPLDAASSSFAAPSPLDQIDPESIETIEVLKGPSAATLYGPDAANGVIVITTKKGRPGPARWTMNASRGVSNVPGTYPLGYYRWGTNYFGSTVLCPLGDFSCTTDSLVRFQALNIPKYSALRPGTTTNLSLGATGGSDVITYAITGSLDDATGTVALPAVEIAHFAAVNDGAQPTSWMEHPEQLSRWSASARFAAKLGDKADASFSTSLTRESQQRSDLERNLPLLLTTYIDRTSGNFYRVEGAGSFALISQVTDLLPNIYERVTDDATNFANAGSISWRPWHWLRTSADVGINVIGRQDNALVPYGLSAYLTQDSSGAVNTGIGSTVIGSANLQATTTVPLVWGWHLQLATGANYSTTSQSDLITGATGLVPGTTSLDGATKITSDGQSASTVTSLGWYIEPSFTHQHFTLSTGLRLDGSPTFGRNAQQPLFPKLGGSWLVSEEPFFPFKKIFDVLRLRASYGQAGVWPGPTDQLRLYFSSAPILDGGTQTVNQVATLGNTRLRPEKSDEIETGFDTDLFRDWVSLSFSWYQKMRYDAILPVPIAPSVYGQGITTDQNIGVIRNTGIEGTVTMQLVRTDLIAWSALLGVSRNHNLVTRFNAGVLPFGPSDNRVVVGYPLFGRWARPILAYTDANHDGIIEANEVLLGDTLVFMGASEPNYEANLATTMSLFRGAITIGVTFDYQAGLTQVNNSVGAAGQYVFSPGSSDPHSSFGEQAAVAVLPQTEYGVMQTVNTLRLNSLSVGFHVPSGIARWLTRSSSLNVQLQGTNVALFTNYKGKDPNVNAFSTGNQVSDNGALPLPRVWALSIHTTY